MAVKGRFNICVVTGTRAEYGLLYWLISEIHHDPDLTLQLVATGTHLMKKFGYTLDLIQKDGWEIDDVVDLQIHNDSKKEISDSLSRGISGFTNAFHRLNPDMVVVMGDRYELLAVSSVSLILKIPLAHISGGEITEGAIDDQIRHSLTKIAHLHFTANESFSNRVRQMGEEEWRIHTVGEPGLDYIKKSKKMTRRELEKNLNLDLSLKTALVTVHPTTHDLNHLQDQMNNIICAFQKFDLQFILTYPNADPGHDLIIEKWKQFKKQYPRQVLLIRNLGQKRYISLLQHITLMIGNTSSGIVESPSFGMPVVNIGDRQKGRIAAPNIIQASFDTHDLISSIQKALAQKKQNLDNPYGKSNSSQTIVRIIKQTLETRDPRTILKKKFIDHG